VSGTALAAGFASVFLCVTGGWHRAAHEIDSLVKSAAGDGLRIFAMRMATFVTNPSTSNVNRFIKTTYSKCRPIDRSGSAEEIFQHQAIE